MTKTPPPPAADPGPAEPTTSTTSRARGPPATRCATSAGSAAPPTDRKVAGVAGGLARHLDVDPLILRVALVVLVFFGGAGLIAVRRLLAARARGRRTGAAAQPRRPHPDLALVVVGVVAALALVGDSWGVFWFPWPLAIIALVVLWFGDPQGQAGAAAGHGLTPAPTSAGTAARRSQPRAHAGLADPDDARHPATRPQPYARAPVPAPYQPTSLRPAPRTRASAARSCSGSPSR